MSININALSFLIVWSDVCWLIRSKKSSSLQPAHVRQRSSRHLRLHLIFRIMLGSTVLVHSNQYSDIEAITIRVLGVNLYQHCV